MDLAYRRRPLWLGFAGQALVRISRFDPVSGYYYWHFYSYKTVVAYRTDVFFDFLLFLI